MTETEIPTSETQEVLEPTIEDMIQAEDGMPFTRFRILDILFHDGDFQISGFPSMEKVDSIFA